MTGYKVLDNNMRSFIAGMQYDTQEVYSTDEEISLIDNKGFHFCEDLVEALKWVKDTNNYRIFLIDTLDGEVINGLYTSVSSKIKLVRELTHLEIADVVIEYIVNNK